MKDIRRDEDGGALVDDQRLADPVGARARLGRALQGGGDGGVQPEGLVAGRSVGMNLRSEVNIRDAHDGVEVREARELCGVDGLAGAGREGSVELGAETLVRGGMREHAEEGVAERDGGRVRAREHRSHCVRHDHGEGRLLFWVGHFVELGRVLVSWDQWSREETCEVVEEVVCDGAFL